MIFGAPGWVVDAGVIFGALVAFGTFCGLAARSPIGRWFGRQIMEQAEEWVERVSAKAAAHALAASKSDLDSEVEERLEEMLPRHLRPILYELRSNGGGSFRDQVLSHLRKLDRRHDRFSTFMDESTMDRRNLREMFENQIQRSALDEDGTVDDRKEDE